MDYFGHVHFGRDEREQQREFLLAMNGAEIIQISREEIENWYAEDVFHNSPGCDNHVVLHGEAQKNRFRYIMDAFFPKKKYEITEEPGSLEFRNWLEKKERKHG